MKEFWNERYRDNKYAYGEAPNVYFEQCLKQLKPGKLLLPAEGEGRNGVFAASLNWIIDAFDISEEGKKKALQLAEKYNTTISYTIADFNSVVLPSQVYDAVALIYAHLHDASRKVIHYKIASSLKQKGHIIIEAFSKANLDYVNKNPKVGGPRDIAMLYDLEEIKADFPDFTWLEAYTTTTILNEGEFHCGEGAVVRLFGEKH
jgi:hypothetical protein